MRLEANSGADVADFTVAIARYDESQVLADYLLIDGGWSALGQHPRFLSGRHGRRVCGMMGTPKRGRRAYGRGRTLAFAAIAALTLLVDVGTFYVCRSANAVRPEFLFWVVGQYAQPWATLLLVVGISLALLAVWYAFFSPQWQASKRIAVVCSALLLGFLLAAELSMGIAYESIAGEFEITEGLFPRTHLQFRSTQDGVCLHADARGFLSWTLNGIAVHPRLLPLPLAASELREKLQRANCEGRY